MIAPAPTAEVVKFTSTVEPLTLPVGFETVTFVPTALYVAVSFESTDTLKITFPVWPAVTVVVVLGADTVVAG